MLLLVMMLWWSEIGCCLDCIILSLCWSSRECVSLSVDDVKFAIERERERGGLKIV